MSVGDDAEGPRKREVAQERAKERAWMLKTEGDIIISIFLLSTGWE